ncbi:MAG: hypothetical protein JRF32_05790, partial [Deltaproteobacteria bacterium]|nr:hypothetical protein [Deltaproteobacteria bacterium]
WENETAVNRWLLASSGVALEALMASPEGIVYDQNVEHRKFENRPFPTPSGKFEFSSKGLNALGCPPCPSYKSPEYLTTAVPGFPLRMISGSRKAIYYHSRFREIENVFVKSKNSNMPFPGPRLKSMRTMQQN